ncbi:DUF3081 domain-containing protein [Photobacterium angustum]|uniref:DUF3081 domain-containing protein n=1 Tax=Photobacterium angustum TaxID=661 RepID=A0A855SIA0_PHOAN|nr:DUF3081 domain-containing protein [Photobacterium angustum]KJF80966.1 hypothetical protein UB36_15090 [Photobacterium damselae subsp. damselae]KJG34278.1 hypothetical protein UA69_00325 [Photobacterium angustum]KJG38827.1 hypothetical protein UA35_15050 [Photobacterium angustum]KJG44433.1 hypothetical protein UA31_15095 [Photobacterium angustum]KJG50457.1 hypothetical protein UA30_00510 [Photobacterium angustum]
MERKLTIKEFLRVFDYIRSTGEQLNNRYKLGDIYAWHDYDGYTCWLNYRDVTVTLMFHGSLNVEYDKLANYSDFTHQCLAMLATSDKENM